MPTFGKYEILRELGRGAMGVVYEARDPSNGVEVALKVMSPPSKKTKDAEKRQEERFGREARALSGLNHPHVVHLTERGEIGGRPYFCMELVRGSTLKERLHQQGPLSLADLVRLAHELCAALDYIHSHGVVHRDVKPENIMMQPEGAAKLMDFGVAQLLSFEDLTSLGGFHGSPAYMAPEQVAGGLVDARTDVYALGITLYEAATARRAVEGDSISVIVQKVAREYPTPPAGLPLYFQAILMRAMSKDPAHRYQRAGDMAEDLRMGRIPEVTFSPIAAPQPAPAPPPPSPTASGAVFFGSPIPAPPPFASGGPAPTPPAVATRIACPAHPYATSVGSCTRCGRPICNGCLVELPQNVILCRDCLFPKP
jgi:eukaryotic-like serine/threonine-protein kinase